MRRLHHPWGFESPRFRPVTTGFVGPFGPWYPGVFSWGVGTSDRVLRHEGSFVATVLKPVRDLIFHCKPLSSSLMRRCPERACDERSFIELGEGTYLETRYEFPDAIFEKRLLELWGESDWEL